MKDKKIDIDELCERWHNGHTAVQIAEHFGVASQTVLTRISKLRAAGDTRAAYRRTKAPRATGPVVTDDAGHTVTQAAYDALCDRVYRLERELRRAKR